MSSTALHNNLGLTIPSTQNTAPILDFRCLYTHDLRRKAKRWQDGTLRFHTFNKRIMVYDLSKNFIGDHHWCEKDPLQDGDELELDKGVLIQVGDSTGTTIQDLSGLFEKRKKAQPDTPGRATPTKPCPATATRPTPVQLSQLRPKSLNALLGTPKGPLGRATVPSKSPCQLRLGDENARMEQKRSVKRQRVETQSEKAVLAVELPKKRSARSDKAAIANILSSVRPTISDTSSTEQQIAGGGRRPIEEKISMTNSETALSIKPKKVISKTEVKQNPAFNEDDSSEIDGTCKRNVPPNSALESSKPRGDRIASPLHTSNFSEKRGKPQLPDAERRNQLQIVARKPRGKLLYKDLLPQSANSSKLSTDEVGSTRKSIEAGCRGPIADTRVKRHQAEHDRLKARFQRIKEKEEKVLHAIGDLGQISPADWEFDTLTSIPSSRLEQNTKKPPDTTQPHSKILTEHLTYLPNHSFSDRNHSILHNRPSSPLISLHSNISEPKILIPNSPPQVMRSKPPDSLPSNSSPRRKINSARRAPVPVLMQDQKPDPWSREAWDIFGHGRPEKNSDC